MMKENHAHDMMESLNIFCTEIIVNPAEALTEKWQTREKQQHEGYSIYPVKGYKRLCMTWNIFILYQLHL